MRRFARRAYTSQWLWLTRTVNPLTLFQPCMWPVWSRWISCSPRLSEKSTFPNLGVLVWKLLCAIKNLYPVQTAYSSAPWSYSCARRSISGRNRIWSSQNVKPVLVLGNTAFLLPVPHLDVRTSSVHAAFLFAHPGNFFRLRDHRVRYVVMRWHGNCVEESVGYLPSAVSDDHLQYVTDTDRGPLSIHENG